MYVVKREGGIAKIISINIHEKKFILLKFKCQIKTRKENLEKVHLCIFIICFLIKKYIYFIILQS